jgi:hypothetical protein
MKNRQKSVVEPRVVTAVVSVCPPEPILTLAQATERLQLKPETVRELLRKRGNRKPLPSLKAGKFLRFKWSLVERWLDETQERAA